MLPPNATFCGRIFARMVELIANVSSFVTVLTPCRRFHFNMTVKAHQVIGTLKPRYIDMVSIWISFHLPDMLRGERLLNVAIPAGHRGCRFTVGMAPGTLWNHSAVSEHVMVADRTVIRDVHMLCVVKINAIVKVGQGVYLYERRRLAASAESGSNEKQQRHDYPFQYPSFSIFHSFVPPHMYRHSICPRFRHHHYCT